MREIVCCWYLFWSHLKSLLTRSITPWKTYTGNTVLTEMSLLYLGSSSDWPMCTITSILIAYGLLTYLGQPNRCCLLVRSPQAWKIPRSCRQIYWLYFTGYRQNISGEHGLDGSGVWVRSKNFTISRLLKFSTQLQWHFRSPTWAHERLLQRGWCLFFFMGHDAEPTNVKIGI